MILVSDFVCEQCGKPYKDAKYDVDNNKFVCCKCGATRFVLNEKLRNFQYRPDNGFGWFKKSCEEKEEKWKSIFKESLENHEVREPHNAAKASDALRNIMGKMYAEKEATTMQAEYKGFTGELVKLEATYLSTRDDLSSTYNLTIFDRANKCEHSFSDVKLGDVKFLDGTVRFGE